MHQVNSCIRIAGTGSCVPDRVVSNAELVARAGTQESWVVENLGIRERRVIGPGEFCSDLGTKAARRALEAAGLGPNDLDVIIVATATPDRGSPSTACIVQHKLGVTNGCPAFDLNAVCSGFLYAMSVGSQFIQSGIYRNVLVIGADTFSRITNWDRRDCVFFGDGAGAVILQRTEVEDGFFCFELSADGRGQDNFTVYPGHPHFTMNGRAVYETATTVLPQTIQGLLAKHGLSVADVSHLIPHQPSVRVLRRTAEVLGLPAERVAMNMDRYANTAGATIPILLDETVRGGRIQSGNLVVFAAVGSGWTWGAALYRWQD
ncbi:3-oxoacyl-ACP synthase III family protein [Geothrix fuzhouensis]|uniref:3-oxoacyl-ACP synthase III family protein n=1 Tax=Geothrix fuzhouensis TaxID=2966451 RepID=UPI002147E5E7|nr:beta-ketoacyl-ACP synthase III [Geothrix fuzhouensis]